MPVEENTTQIQDESSTSNNDTTSSAPKNITETTLDFKHFKLVCKQKEIKVYNGSGAHLFTMAGKRGSGKLYSSILPSLLDEEFVEHVIQPNWQDILDLWKRLALEIPDLVNYKLLLDDYIRLLNKSIVKYASLKANINLDSKVEDVISKNEVSGVSKSRLVLFNADDNYHLHMISAIQKVLFPIYFMNKFTSKGLEYAAERICSINNAEETLSKVRYLCHMRVASAHAPAEKKAMFKWLEYQLTITPQIIEHETFKEVISSVIMSANKVTNMAGFIISVVDKIIFQQMMLSSMSDFMHHPVDFELTEKTYRKKIESLVLDYASSKFLVPYINKCLNNGIVSKAVHYGIMKNYKLIYRHARYFLAPYVIKVGFSHHQLTMSNMQHYVMLALYVLMSKFDKTVARYLVSKKLRQSTKYRITKNIAGVQMADEKIKKFLQNNSHMLLQELSGDFEDCSNNTIWTSTPQEALNCYLSFIKLIMPQNLAKIQFGDHIREFSQRGSGVLS